MFILRRIILALLVLLAESSIQVIAQSTQFEFRPEGGWLCQS